MTSRSTLISQLQGQIISLHDIPSTAQAGQAIDDAVAELGVALPHTLRTTLAIAAGTASYDLPADFIRLIRLSIPTTSAGDVAFTSEGIVPLSRTVSERVTVAHGQLTLYPTPLYAAERDLWYAAADVLDTDGDSYPTLDASRARIALHAARAIVLELQADRAAQDAWLSEIGPEKVDKTKQAAELRAAATLARAQFTAAVASQVGPYGSRS